MRRSIKRTDGTPGRSGNSASADGREPSYQPPWSEISDSGTALFFFRSEVTDTSTFFQNSLPGREFSCILALGLLLISVLEVILINTVLQKMHLIRRTSRMILGLLSLAIGACGVVVAYYLFAGAHFLVSDWVGDQREMQDFAVSTPFWRDVLGYFPFYAPSLIAGLIGLLFIGLGAASFLRAPRSNSSTTSPT